MDINFHKSRENWVNWSVHTTELMLYYDVFGTHRCKLWLNVQIFRYFLWATILESTMGSGALIPISVFSLRFMCILVLVYEVDNIYDKTRIYILHPPSSHHPPVLLATTSTIGWKSLMWNKSSDDQNSFTTILSDISINLITSTNNNKNSNDCQLLKWCEMNDVRQKTRKGKDEGTKL